MKALPLDWRRTYIIARRDFLGYIKTWGFWLTALGPFLGVVVGVLFPLLMSKSEPTRYATIIDETGLHAHAIEELQAKENRDMVSELLRAMANFAVSREDREDFNKILDEQGNEAAKTFIKQSNPFLAKHLNMPESKLVFVPAPVQTLDAITPYLTGDKKIEVDNMRKPLSGALHIYQKDGKTQAEFWSTSATNTDLVNLTERYFGGIAVDAYLAPAGLTRDKAREIRKNALKVNTFNPAKQADDTDGGGQSMTIKDKIPYFVSAALAMLLWFSVFTGAYMLLMSMVEEKINKVLEMLLASTRFSEIFVGKLLGVAALTIASLLPWLILGGGGFWVIAQFANGAVAEGIAQSLSLKMLLFLPVFFILGYVFYGSMFIALGALAESMQDASTLMTPMVLVLTACIMVVPIGIINPDSPMLSIAAWIPFSAPFAAVIRLPSEPPIWETIGSILVLIISSFFVIWGSSRMFRYGVLSGGGMASVKAWISRVVLRKKVG